jgi:hypothetical protein
MTMRSWWNRLIAWCRWQWAIRWPWVGEPRRLPHPSHAILKGSLQTFLRKLKRQERATLELSVDGGSVFVGIDEFGHACVEVDQQSAGIFGERAVDGTIHYAEVHVDRRRRRP